MSQDKAVLITDVALRDGIILIPESSQTHTEMKNYSSNIVTALRV